MPKRDRGERIPFTDQRARRIELWIDDDWPPTIIALYNGEKIGHLEFQEWDDGMDDPRIPRAPGLMLRHVEVQERFQRAGIGTAMMRAAAMAFEGFFVPGKTWQGGREGRNDTLYYSTEGAALLSSCERNGAIRPSAFADYNEGRPDLGD